MPKGSNPRNFTAPEIDEIAKFLPGYEIKAFIAKGGMGAVYMARQKSLDRQVAIKILPSHLGKDDEFREQFKTEAKSMAKLNHPNIISVYDFGECDDQLFIVMEMVPGKSLYHSAYGKKIDPQQSGRIIRDICLGLSHAHEQGILHRDLKPPNILLTPDRTPKIGDFGLARHVSDHHADSGYWTPGYTAPEVAKNPEAVNESTDLYSVGIMLYELIAGERPGDSYTSVSSIVGCDPGFDRIIRKAIDPLPSNRFNSAKEMATAIDEVIKRIDSAVAKKTNVSAPKKLLVPDREPHHGQGAQVHIGGYPQRLRASKAGFLRRPMRNTAIAMLILLGVSFAWKQGWLNREQQHANQVSENAARETSYQPKNSSTNALSKVGGGSKQSVHENKVLSANPAPPKEQNLAARKLAFGDSEYQLIKQEMSWHQARDHCEQLGGHLAIITSKEECDFVTGLVLGNSAWLGATDAHKEGDWRWLNGSELVYKDWQNAQPDNWGNEDFLEIGNVDGGKWNDLMGEALRYFICEWSDALKEHYALKAKAQQGDPVAQTQLAGGYYHGLGVARDDKEAFKWYREAAEQGNAAGQHGLAHCYRHGRGVAQNHQEAVSWARKAAEQGHAGGQAVLGSCYALGTGVMKDLQKAVSWTGKAAEQGHRRAQYELGQCYHQGQGVAKDLEQAHDLYQKAADQKHAEAIKMLPRLQFELGESHYKIRKFQDAVKWYQMSVLQGYADAQFKLAKCYYEGKGINKDRNKARDLLRQAAEQGHVEARKAFFKL